MAAKKTTTKTPPKPGRHWLVVTARGHFVSHLFFTKAAADDAAGATGHVFGPYELLERRAQR